MDKYISLKEFCELLDISYATGKNWIKTNKIKPSAINGKSVLFEKEYAQKLKNKIINSENLLKNRRNKKYASGSFLYEDYIDKNSPNIKNLEQLLKDTETNGIEIERNFIITILAKACKQLIKEKFGKDIDFLTDDLLKERTQTPKNIPEFSFKYVENEDTLGFIYISLNNTMNRKASGSYYTPEKIVKKLCCEIFNKEHLTNKTIIDPCCGSGNFLLQLPDNTDFKSIYGGDTDTIAVKLARINMVLKFGIQNKKDLYSHIKECNFLFSENNMKFDYIIGNPPWACEFSKEEKEKLKKHYHCAPNDNIESYDVITEQALKNLKKNGTLAFILPEAILNVKSHTKIREIICNTCNVSYLEYLGDVFSNVQCPSIILALKKTENELNPIGTIVKTIKQNFEIKQHRKITPENFTFSINDNEYNITDKISKTPNALYLKGNSKFALGIVTGDNNKYIASKKTKNNEIIIKGTNLKKYGYKSLNSYINFKENTFQQVAPQELYRAKEKLIYKFISKKLAFNYDDKQYLTLNSCNILIPEIKDLDIKYILAILNSGITQFYFGKTFNSTKVLRSHLESIPIPHADKNTQKEIINIVNTLLTAENPEKALLYKKLDKIIAKLYNLTEKEYDTICNALN